MLASCLVVDSFMTGDSDISYICKKFSEEWVNEHSYQYSNFFSFITYHTYLQGLFLLVDIPVIDNVSLSYKFGRECKLR